MSGEAEDPPLGAERDNHVNENNNGEVYGQPFVPRTLRDYHIPRADDAQGPITLPQVVGDPPNFGSGVVNLIQQNCFHGLEVENPHEHLNNFLQCCQTVKSIRASTEYVKLALFPFSLRDKANVWFNSLPKGSVNSWAQMCNLFLAKYYPVRRTAKVRAQITGFKQGYDESLSDAWDRFNHLLQSCPHHNLNDWMLVDSFYNALAPQSRALVDTGAGGTIIDMEPQEILELFERLAQQQQWSNREGSRGTGGRYEVDELAMMQAKLDALQRQVDQQRNTPKKMQVQSCSLCGDETHVYEGCPLAQPDEGNEHVNSINNEESFYPKPPFSRSYSYDPEARQAWREKLDRANFGSFNNQGQPSRFQNQGSNQNQGQGSGNRNLYNNTHFPNQGPNRSTQQFNNNRS